jgi:hypothetical protein
MNYIYLTKVVILLLGKVSLSIRFVIGQKPLLQLFKCTYSKYAPSAPRRGTHKFVI